MGRQRVVGDVDLISVADAIDLAAVDGPCISVFMPTHRFGPETLQGPIRLRNLVERAAAALDEGGTPRAVVDDLLTPVRGLVDDPDFWQHQSDGLAVFAAPGRFSSFRVPLHVDEEVTVAASFRIRPLVPLLSGDGIFLILAVSQNSVRLFEATRGAIGELDPGTMPTSIDEALAHEDHERQLQVRSGGGGTAQFHGHGVGDEVDKATVERFLRAVDHGLAERVGATTHPLVLACVGYYLPMFRAVSSYPAIVDTAIEGNPERRQPDELHASAWQIVERRFAAGNRAETERYREAAGRGNTVSELEQVVAMARQGRVEAVFVAGGVGPWGRPSTEPDGVAVSETPSLTDVDLIDRAVLDTLARGGRVIAAPDLLDGAPVAALLRY